MPTLRLTSITCEMPEETDKDEIYLMFQGQKIWPPTKKFQQIDVDEEIDLDVQLRVSDDWAEIELWEYDYTSKNDHLGTFHIRTDDLGSFTEILTTNEGVAERAGYYLSGEVF